MSLLPGQALAQQQVPPLSDQERADVLAAVDRVNAAQIEALQSLDTSVLEGVATDPHLRLLTAEVDQLRRAGRRETAVNSSFTVSDVARTGQTRALVRTTETWSAEIYDIDTGELVDEVAPSETNQAYVVEYRDGGWIVMANGLDPLGAGAAEDRSR